MKQTGAVRLTLVVIVIVVALLSGASISPAFGTAAFATASVVPSSLDDDDCVSCLKVNEEESCPGDWHYAWDNTGSPEQDAWTRNGGAHLDGLCRWGTCDVRHGPLCTQTFPSPVDSAALQFAVAADDAAGVVRALLDHSDQVLLNRARSAVQVLNCSKAVSLHAPLSSGMLARVSELLEASVPTSPR